MDDTPLQVGRELRRIGVDERRLGALAAQGITADALLRWLRWLPTDLGHEAFMARLERWADDGGLKAAVASDALPAVDAHYVDAEADELLALLQELDRVAPGRAGGINFPTGRTRALALLRLLPNGAGVEAVTAALNADRDQMSNDR
jgi:hypothetical protein